MTAAQYSIVNVATSQTFAWPASTILGSTAICTAATSSPWSILLSVGYYSISQSNLILRSGGIASPSGFDSSVWKLLKFDTGNYRIVNKATGLLPVQDATGPVVEAAQSALSDRRNEWKLVQSPNTVQRGVANSEREVSFTNGVKPKFRID